VAEEDLLTIEQLAARSGLSVRNIRSHVTRGLLPPPVLRARTGYYTAEHLARLQLITSLQQQGFNLTAIAKLVRGPVATSAEETVAFYRTILSAWLTEEPRVCSEAELAAIVGEAPAPRHRATLERLGIIEALDNGQVRLRNPALLQTGAQVMALGYDADTLLALAEVLVDHTGSVAEACLAMFAAHHWEPYVAAGQPPAELPEIRRVIEQLQPLASQAIVAAFQQEMTALVARTFTGAAADAASRAVTA
jgi:DNA-binding transcriptional MerR regulator